MIDLLLFGRIVDKIALGMSNIHSSGMMNSDLKIVINKIKLN